MARPKTPNLKQSTQHQVQMALGRVKPNLGTPHALPFVNIVEIELNSNNAFTYAQLIKQYPYLGTFSERDLLHLVQEKFYGPLRNYLLSLIYSIVPADSYRLRNSLEQAIGGNTHLGNITQFAAIGSLGKTNSSISNTSGLHPFNVKFGSSLQYASIANNWETFYLRHPHAGAQSISYRKGRKMKKAHALYDPEAEQHWYERIIREGRSFAQSLAIQFINLTLAHYMEPVAKAYQLMQKSSVMAMNGQYLASTLFSWRFN